VAGILTASPTYQSLSDDNFGTGSIPNSITGHNQPISLILGGMLKTKGDYLYNSLADDTGLVSLYVKENTATLNYDENAYYSSFKLGSDEV